MSPDPATTLRDILQTQQLAALGTLHMGQPFVSMVPFAVLPGGDGFVIHVSELAAHTKDMLANPGVSLLMVALQVAGIPAQATARVTVQGGAEPWDASAKGYAQAREAYLARFPQSADMFGFADFSLFVIRPTSVRFVGGFAQAKSFTPGTLASILGTA